LLAPSGAEVASNVGSKTTVVFIPTPISATVSAARDRASLTAILPAWRHRVSIRCLSTSTLAPFKAKLHCLSMLGGAGDESSR